MTANLTTSRPASPGRLLVTAREAAAMLSVSERTLWTLSARGDIPRVRLLRAVRYSVDDLREYIARQTNTGDAR